MDSKQTDIAIIGGGPIGCYCAYHLAKAGKQVTILEEHNEIGKPIGCTGIVTKDIQSIVKLGKSIVNQIKIARIGCKNTFIDIPIDDIVINRTIFDSMIAKKALNSGTRIKFSTKINEIVPDGKGFVLRSKNNKIKCNKLIGADGPHSIVAKYLGQKFNYIIGHQVRCKGKFNPDRFDVNFDVPGFFGWVVPESNSIARIGVGSVSKPGLHLKKLLKKLNNPKILENQSGIIPIYRNSVKSAHKNIFLVGDAAAQIKATTGGGLVPGLKSAKILADAIVQEIDYDSIWKKTVGKNLQTHRMIRTILNRFSEKDYVNLIKYLSYGQGREVFAKISRDQPIWLGFNLLLRKPLLPYYALKGLF